MNAFVMPLVSAGPAAGESHSQAAPVTATDDLHLDAGAIEAIVERVVQRELAPVKEQLAHEAWGLRDVVAGVGYILGLMGLASYVQYRKTSRGRE